MIRIGIQNDEAATYASQANRLRGAVLVDAADECDAVVIPANTPARETLCQEALQAGKHLLIEMPLAETSEAAQSLIEACAKAGVRLMAGNAKRYLPSMRTVKEVLAAGKLGQPGLLRIHRWDAHPSAQSLLQRLVCEIDLVVWLFGTSPTEVYAVGRDEYVQVHFGFPEDGMALIDVTIVPNATPYYSLSLIGSTGAAYADDHHNMQLLYQAEKPTSLLTSQGSLHHLAQLQEFVDAVNENRQPAISGGDGLLALQIAETVTASMNQSRAAHLSGDRYEFV